MTTPVAWLVAERRDGQVLLGDDFTQRCDDEADARWVAERWESSPGFDVVILAVVEAGPAERPGGAQALAVEVAEVIAEWYGRPAIAPDFDLARQIIARVRGEQPPPLT